MEKNTIVLFTSDHGDMLGSQGQRLKRKPWEESIRVPGILRWPARVKAGRRVDALLSHVDFAPTLLSLCGVKPPKEMQGADLVARGAGQERPRPGFRVLSDLRPFAGDGTPHPWRGVRTSRYMYARTEKSRGCCTIWNKDPNELKNLASRIRPASAVRKQLEARRRRSGWRDTGDSWQFNSNDAGRGQGPALSLRHVLHHRRVFEVGQGTSGFGAEELRRQSTRGDCAQRRWPARILSRR